jgi:phosphohistidine phosphatase
MPLSSRLLLLRHARAGWAMPGGDDFGRTLTESGRREARWIARAMREQGFVPDRVVHSPAARAVETWEEAAAILGDIPAIADDSLYHSDALRYLQCVRREGSAAALLIVGHNPMLEDLALALAESDDPARIAPLRRGLPTASLAVIAFAGPLGEIGPGSGRLEAFLAPDPLATAR